MFARTKEIVTLGIVVKVKFEEVDKMICESCEYESNDKEEFHEELIQGKVICYSCTEDNV